jgi:hypothetical protein
MSEDVSEKMPFWKKALLAAIPAVIALIGGVYLSMPRPGPDKDFTGRVINDRDGAYIYKAKVSVEADQNVPQNQYTDADGIFHVTLPETTKEVHVNVQAQGYKPLEKSVTLTRTGVEKFYLTPEESSTPPSSTPTPQSSPEREKRTGGSNDGSSGRSRSNSNKVPTGSRNREAEIRDALNTRGTSPTPGPR